MIPECYLGINDSHLVNYCEQHRMLTEVCHAFEQMRQAALNDGVDISIASSFRSFQRQALIWQQKWSGSRPIFNTDGQAVDINRLSDEQKIYMILNWSALPGTSRHHWGTDLDVYDRQAVIGQNHTLNLVHSEYVDDGPCAALSKWLEVNMTEYGFYRPYDGKNSGYGAEPWHISYQPLARDILKQFDTDALVSQLHQQNIAGLSTINQHIDNIVERYVLCHLKDN